MAKRVRNPASLELPLVPTGAKHATDNLAAYDYYLRGFPPYFTFTKAGVAKSRELYEQALAVDPKFVGAMAMLGITYLMDVMNGYSADPARDLQRGYELAQKAVAVDDTISGPYMLLSQINLRHGQEARNMNDAKRYYALAADYANRGIALDPSDPFGYVNLAAALYFFGEAQRRYRSHLKSHTSRSARERLLLDGARLRVLHDGPVYRCHRSTQAASRSRHSDNVVAGGTASFLSSHHSRYLP
jgi:hypothetical protein